MSNNWKRIGGVASGGDVGGDHQATEAYSVRYIHTDRSGAVVTVYFYGVLSDRVLGHYAVEAQTEMAVCSDRRHPGDTEQWADSRYQLVNRERYATVEAVGRAARDAASRHRPSGIAWDGRAPWEKDG